MRNWIRNIILNIAGSISSVAKGVHILNSHFIGREDLPQEIFYDLLKEISKHADFIKIQDAIKSIEEKNYHNQKLVAFTFDDGFEECYTKIAPVLESFNVNAALFINPGFIDGDSTYCRNFKENVVHVNKNPMSWDMIKKLHDKGFVVGNHTYDHVRLTGLNDDSLQKQILDAKKRIESVLNTRCDYFAWTYGRYSDIDSNALEYALKTHQYVFSSDNYTRYYSFGGRVINRRHIEGNWPFKHVKYFLSKNKH